MSEEARIIRSQARLIGSLRVSLRYYSGVSHCKEDLEYRHDAAILQKKAIRSNRRARAWLKRNGYGR